MFILNSYGEYLKHITYINRKIKKEILEKYNSQSRFNNNTINKPIIIKISNFGESLFYDIDQQSTIDSDIEDESSESDFIVGGSLEEVIEMSAKAIFDNVELDDKEASYENVRPNLMKFGLEEQVLEIGQGLEKRGKQYFLTKTLD